MKQFIAISAIGDDRIGLVHDLSKVVADCGGSISESRMTALGSDFAMLLLVAGIIGSLAQSIVGYSHGGCAVSIVMGFIGALLGTWLARASSV